jgi:Tol biopolymer transport system component
VAESEVCDVRVSPWTVVFAAGAILVASSVFGSESPIAANMASASKGGSATAISAPTNAHPAMNDVCIPAGGLKVGYRVLTEGDEPALSRDGKSVAFVRGNSIRVMELATRKERVVLQPYNPHYPAWSPDGTRLAFQSGDPFAIYIVSVDGSSLRQLMPPGPKDQHPLWSPDGKSIVWTHGTRLWIADATGANAHALTPDSTSWYEVACDWSPDGQTVLYTSAADQSSGFTLNLVDRDGKNARPDPTAARAGQAQWSRDGRMIVFAEGQILWRREHFAGGMSVGIPIGDTLDGVSVALAPDGSFLLHDCIVESDAGTDKIIWVPLR